MLTDGWSELAIAPIDDENSQIEQVERSQEIGGNSGSHGLVSL
jgi:hypothetical protein